jgi:hypothetical protein
MDKVSMVSFFAWTRAEMHLAQEYIAHKCQIIIWTGGIV